METTPTSPSSPEILPSREMPTKDPLRAAIRAAQAHAWSRQRADGHWCGELESNSTITAEYVFMKQALGLDLEAERERMVRYFRGNQKSDGSWGIAWNLAGDVSTTTETYLALRILGVEPTDPALKNAERFIRDQGGVEKIRVFTRINLALFGLFPWEAVPVIPPEFILLPKESPVNIYSLSSWARGTMVPLFVIFHYKPCFALPNMRSRENPWLDHLWLDPTNKCIPYTERPLDIVRRHKLSWKSIFALADVGLRAFDRRHPEGLREFAVTKCLEWVLEHQEESGDWAGIFPPMVNGVLALYLSGYGLDSEPLRKGLEAIERFAIDDAQGFRVQACVSPVWDTILMMIGMIDTGHDVRDARLQEAREWIEERQLLVDHGDWKVYNPDGPSGGWSFEYVNSWYPDVDDTAAVVIGFLKQDPASRSGFIVRRAVEWIVSMQNRDGGWAAFDINNDKRFLNEIPFSDMDSLCDESSPDVTGRVLEALGLLNDPKYNLVCQRGIGYLRSSQEKQGSWYGRWGVNYVYGTSNVLCALGRLKTQPSEPMIGRAIAWLKSVQNEDGGWGECLESYRDKNRMGEGPSTASQTAWAVMGLLAYVPASDPAVERGVKWLLRRQTQGTWEEAEFTGTGFPNHFYLNYHLYRHYFPMMALGRYAAARVE